MPAPSLEDARDFALPAPGHPDAAKAAAGDLAAINGLLVFLVLEGVLLLAAVRGGAWPVLAGFAALQALLVADVVGLRRWLDLSEVAAGDISSRVRGGLGLHLLSATSLMVLLLRWQAGTEPGLDPAWAETLPGLVSLGAAAVTISLRSRPVVWVTAGIVAGVQFLGAIWPLAVPATPALAALIRGLWLGGSLALALAAIRHRRLGPGTRSD